MRAENSKWLVKVNILAKIFEYVNLFRKSNSVEWRSRKLTFVVSDIKLKAFFNFDRHFKRFRFLSLHIYIRGIEYCVGHWRKYCLITQLSAPSSSRKCCCTNSHVERWRWEGLSNCLLLVCSFWSASKMFIVKMLMRISLTKTTFLQVNMYLFRILYMCFLLFGVLYLWYWKQYSPNTEN